DALIVNTCSFLNDAKEESIEAILESEALRTAQRPGQALIVSGCLPQRFQKDLPTLMPEVDAFLGIDQLPQIGAIVRQALARRTEWLKQDAGKQPTSQIPKSTSRVGRAAPQGGTQKAEPAKPVVMIHPRPTYLPDYATPRFRLTPRHFAYLKIAEGCNHPCSFCIIPRIRGGHRSRPLPDILSEARKLLSEGVKELNLISQDSTYYGLDRRSRRLGSRAISDPAPMIAGTPSEESPTLCTLLRELDRLPGDFWIRILYTHPAHWTDQLIETIAACRKVARYVDIPLQHIHENMLQRMRRETSQEHILDLIRKIRAGIPGLVLRTTLIVGFPGETEACFQTLLDFIRFARFERLGVFAYSREEGTVAGQMTGQIPEAVKQRRRALAMAEQHKIAQAIAGSFVGRTLKVLVEGEASARQLKAAKVNSWEHGLIREDDPSARRLRGHYFVARGEADAPDIDGRVYFRGPSPSGRFIRVRVIAHTDYDLIAEPVGRPPAHR
ncbi:MAG: 30S ribosomal protein S12 methylthiotransferase RimO, partial [Verrucomicrobia bacterium]|nr:30S ribosomal protein S12 methylthiotransferase RimO [Verrucomicrobiota bacterium]